MKRRILGGTGISVSEYALGSAMFGSVGGPDYDDSARIISRALDAGINFLDTSDLYGRGEAEKCVGKAIKGRRDEIVLATKFGNKAGTEEPNWAGGSRRWVNRAIDASLQRLGTDY